eukprot:RCo019016
MLRVLLLLIVPTCAVSAAAAAGSVDAVLLTSGTRVEYLRDTLNGLRATGFDGEVVLAYAPPQRVGSKRTAEAMEGQLREALNTSVVFRVVHASQGAGPVSYIKNRANILAVRLGMGTLRGMRAIAPGRGVLLLEDDVRFCEYFWPLLRGLSAVIEARGPFYLLSMYNHYPSSTASRWRAFAPGLLLYPLNMYMGIQAMYISAAAVPPFSAFFEQQLFATYSRHWPPNPDILVRYFAGGSPALPEHPRRECTAKAPCPLLVISNHSLVQHTGQRSLMAKFQWTHHHYADNFLQLSGNMTCTA